MRPRIRGSFDPAEVTWLLQDLADVDLERSLQEREEHSQGGGSYAEVLPIEEPPSPAYSAAFDRALAAEARHVATLVATLAEELLRRKGSSLQLVSLARAGTPVGVLLRRWLQHHHQLEVEHLSLSIVRGVGIDRTALELLGPPAAVAFIDGWTGKGAIAGELDGALRGLPFDPTLAVLADPGHCTSLAATREDVLIPSALLNSTVCGLVSRTVYRPDLSPPGTLHGAKVYDTLAPWDRTAELLDTITGYFGDVTPCSPAQGPADRRGAREVRAVQEEFGLPSWHLVKPGIGETTRVLLRRRPWQILVDPARLDGLSHLLLLAQERDVEVIERPGMAYSCMGLVRPVIPGNR